MSLVSSLAQVGNVYTGRIKIVAGNPNGANWTGIQEPHTGWLLCNGAVIPNSGKYFALFGHLGTKFGAAGTLPNILGGIVPIPKGTGFSIGAAGGEINHTLTIAEMASHNHAISDRGVADGGHPGTMLGYFPPWQPVANYQAFGYLDAQASHDVNAAGGGGSHNNMPPYQVVGVVMVKL